MCGKIKRKWKENIDEHQKEVEHFKQKKGGVFRELLTQYNKFKKKIEKLHHVGGTTLYQYQKNT